HGASGGPRELRCGQRALYRLRLGHGPGPDRDDPTPDCRHPAAVRQRRPLPGAVRRRGKGERAMIVSRRWLEALLDRPLDARDTAERLTMHVAPVDAVVPLHQDLGDIVVARVLEVKQHPNADRLTLCLVDAARPGPANRRALPCHKGVARERAALLGGAVKLPPIPGAGSAAPAGGEAALGGRRRAPSARGDVPARAAEPGVAAGPSGRVTAGVVDGVGVRLEDPEGAPRYMIAVIRGGQVASGAGWLAQRLAALGQRPITHAVSAT